MLPTLFNDYGVKYTPTDDLSPNLTIEELEKSGIKYIRLQWVDLVNDIRYRVLPVAYFLKLVASQRPSVSVTKAALGLVFLTLAPGFSATGEYVYAPDLTSMRRCAYTKDHASVMGWFQEKQYVAGPGRDPTMEVDICPRTVLGRVIEDAKRTGIKFLVGFETEFILLRSTSPIQAVNFHGWSNSAAMLAGSDEEKVLNEIAEALQQSGIELQMYHAEAAPGQYEVITGPLQPLQAADALVHKRETIYNVANKYGLRATLTPRLFKNNCGSAAHTHISVHSSQNPSTTVEAESAFLAALLTHLPALAALTMPTPASYYRMVDGVWSGGTYVCWGTDNREAPVRLCNASSHSSRNFEIKCIDGTSNPYLVLAGILGVGHRGICDGAKLSVLDCKGPQTAAELGEEGRKALGITQRMPLSLEEARTLFEHNKVVKEVLGAEMIAKYSAVNKTLAQALAAGGEEESAKLLIEKY